MVPSCASGHPAADSKYASPPPCFPARKSATIKLTHYPGMASVRAPVEPAGSAFDLLAPVAGQSRPKHCDRCNQISTLREALLKRSTVIHGLNQRGSIMLAFIFR